MGALDARHPHSSPAGLHLAAGLLLGGLLGATAGLMVGAKKYAASHMAIGEMGPQRFAEQPQLFAGSGADRADDDCASDPRVAWPLLGLVAGLMLGVTAAQGYDQFRRLSQGRPSTGRARWDADA